MVIVRLMVSLLLDNSSLLWHLANSTIFRRTSLAKAMLVFLLGVTDHWGDVSDFNKPI